MLTATLGASTDLPGHKGSVGFVSFSPATVLVLGFMFLIVLQTGFARHLSRLTARAHADRTTHAKLRADLQGLSKEVSELERAEVANSASITNLEHETAQLQQEIDAAVDERGGDGDGLRETGCHTVCAATEVADVDA
jgi:septal ring factor EnvC (AmiA/AmiB activator)